jgi:hypothetical protein
MSRGELQVAEVLWLSLKLCGQDKGVRWQRDQATSGKLMILYRTVDRRAQLGLTARSSGPRRIFNPVSVLYSGCFRLYSDQVGFGLLSSTIPPSHYRIICAQRVQLPEGPSSNMSREFILHFYFAMLEWR